MEADILLESRRIDEVITEERNFDSGAAHVLRCPSSLNLKSLRLITSSTTFTNHSVPSAGAKNAGRTANDCSGPSNLRVVGRRGQRSERRS